MDQLATSLDVFWCQSLISSSVPFKASRVNLLHRLCYVKVPCWLNFTYLGRTFSVESLIGFFVILRSLIIARVSELYPTSILWVVISLLSFWYFLSF